MVITRRSVLRFTSAIVSSTALHLLAGRGGVRAEADQGANELAVMGLPPDLGQADIEVYVEATGHTLRGGMLDYWRATGGAAIYGNPVSEPFAADGYYSQAFERGVFQYRPEYLYTADPIVRLMPLGRIALSGRSNASSSLGQWWLRASPTDDFPWRPLGPAGRTVARIVEGGGRFIEASGHTIGPDVLPWYIMNEGQFYLGDPMSQPLTERGETAQWFEGGLLLIGEGSPRLAPLGRELAPLLGIDTAPVAQGNLPSYDEALFWTGDNPYPMGDSAAPGMRWVEVSVAAQRLWAYQGDTLVMTTLISTGLDPNLTELGIFHVRLKYLVQDLSGFSSETGEVIGFGDEAPPGTVPYAVSDVPHVMYFNLDAEALHGTYWHSNFGQKMSHGCVNLPLDGAAWMFGWAPLGTEVWVHE